MAIEIERKFLVDEDLLPTADAKIAMVQAYLQADPERTVRVRLTDDSAFLTIKGKLVGFSRKEFEYPIPVEDARELLELAIYPPVEKVRHLIWVDGRKWEVDVFSGANLGLVLAELELPNENEQVDWPSWIKSEVTGQVKYHNSYLSQHPYRDWK
ncbi:CYTH domain-containing protein [Sunxiuqinia dokdonensis]|uniref:Adenylate cyclase n=1 Tax=Sunxiuqinia dokdonensis TaxID=1409788 RepID=A0A0L8V414_9BACT|nr:CYTH domain-containing protein [Sunxiuqinia dokdonensis]KOH43151.1 adenylate cyclase [Sunxiuqinia dokdonensis]